MREQGHGKVARESAQLRERNLVALEEEMACSRAKPQSNLAQEELQCRRNLESNVIDEMFVFVTKLLERLASSVLDELLVRLL